MGERGREELETTSPVLYNPMNRECSLKENSDRKKRDNQRIYNLSFGPYITRFSAVVAKKQNNFEHIFG